MRTPVAFLIFNRPDVTARVFAEIARARPPKLLVVADGARADCPGEREACERTRAVVERVDWDCEVLTNFAGENMGCRRRVSSGITWVFEEVEEAIIVEDDCLPHPSFFPYCEELLARFREDERVMMLSGDNFQFGRRRTPYSYYFSRLMHIWGWASWRRAWRHYDVGMRLWAGLRDTPWLSDLLGDEEAAAFWRDVFDRAAAGHDTWDFQWVFACWAQHGLSALPESNLVTNIGFGAGATHTHAETRAANIPAEALEFPLRHPPHVVREREADLFTMRELMLPAKSSVYSRLRRKLSAAT
ncbi:MAG TPA: hypothetical protein VM864_02575 [Pyrinomonadaceae bacterium]|nr:hypothetical protein [Pyrinomonadaceae bacterium]